MQLITGRIVEERKNYYTVDTPQGEFKALLKGVIRKKTKRLSVGDIISVEVYDKDKAEAVVRKVSRRINELPRPVVANIDQVLFVNCYIEPALDFMYIDRFLFAASINSIDVKMLFNKTDLLDEDDWQELKSIANEYRDIGFEIFFTSIEDDESVTEIKELCSEKLTIFAGPSGVGKSSLMQKIFPELEFETNELSEHIQRGKNTTTHTSLLKLSKNSYIADTPGFSYMKLPKISPAQVQDHFPEILEASQNCRFSNCKHINEPHCSVKELVESGEIVKSRYLNYIDLVDMMGAAEKDYKRLSKKYL